MRLPTGFLPEEDQGYAIIGIQLPSAASLARTEATVKEVEAALKGTPGLAGWVSIGGLSLLDNSTTLANGAVMYLVFTPLRRAREAGARPAGHHRRRPPAHGGDPDRRSPSR